MVIYQFASWKKLPDERIEEVSSGINAPKYQSESESASEALTDLIIDLNVPSSSVAIGVDGEIVWTRAIGFADVDNKTVSTPQTSNRIGSTSKAVTSTAMMLLVKDGLLDLDKNILEYLPEFPAKKYAFTTRQLLSHTAGIVDYEDLSIKYGLYTLLNFKQYDSVAQGLEIFKDEALLFEPGSDFKYNSFDVVLASRVIEKISGMDYLNYLK